MRDVPVIGAYTTAFKKHPGMGFGNLAREAYLGTLSAGMKNSADIEAGWLGNCGMGFWGQKLDPRPGPVPAWKGPSQPS